MGDPVLFGDDRDRVRIPFGEPLTALDMRALVGEQTCAVGHTMAGSLATGFINKHDLAIAPHRNRDTGRVQHDVAVLDLYRRIEGRLDRRLFGTTLCRAADMEGTHR